MNCERLKDLSTDYVTGELPKDLRADVEAHLADCASCCEDMRSSQIVWAKLASLPPAKPSSNMDERFYAMLASQSREPGGAKKHDPSLQVLVHYLKALWPRRPALQFGVAILLFCLGLLLGPSFGLQLRGARQPDSTNQPALEQLRADVAGLKEMVALSLLQQPSASERLRGVEWSQQLVAPDERVLGALISALDSDPNINVRLAAIEALQQFAGSGAIRQGLLASLPRQTSPLVQIELIRLLVELKERDSVPALRALLQDAQINPTVKQRAEWGIEQLT